MNTAILCPRKHSTYQFARIFSCQYILPVAFSKTNVLITKWLPQFYVGDSNNLTPSIQAYKYD